LRRRCFLFLAHVSSLPLHNHLRATTFRADVQAPIVLNHTCPRPSAKRSTPSITDGTYGHSRHVQATPPKSKGRGVSGWGSPADSMINLRSGVSNRPQEGSLGLRLQKRRVSPRPKRGQCPARTRRERRG